MHFESTNGSPSKGGENDVTSANTHLAAGKRALLIGDANGAVTTLATACEKFGKLYGETAKECGEAYLYYGKALLARVIDNVLDGEESEENSAEEEDYEEEAGEGEAEGGAEEGKKDAEKDDAEAGPSGENDVEKDNESIGSNEAGPSSSKESTDQVAQAQEEEDDPSNLQLAWEMLELAKTIFSKHADSLEAKDEKRLALEDKLSETYQTLGEVSIGKSRYDYIFLSILNCAC